MAPTESPLGRSFLARNFRRFVRRYIVPSPVDYLFEDEVELYKERYHIVKLVLELSQPGLVFGFSLAGALLVPQRGLQVFFGVIAFLAEMIILSWVVDWAVTRIVVTNKRLLEVSGFLSLQVLTMPHSKVTDYTLKQSFIGRVLDYGTIRVESAGQVQALEQLDYVRQAVLLYQAEGIKAIN